LPYSALCPVLVFPLAHHAAALFSIYCSGPLRHFTDNDTLAEVPRGVEGGAIGRALRWKLKNGHRWLPHFPDGRVDGSRSSRCSTASHFPSSPYSSLSLFPSSVFILGSSQESSSVQFIPKSKIPTPAVNDPINSLAPLEKPNLLNPSLKMIPIPKHAIPKESGARERRPSIFFGSASIYNAPTYCINCHMIVIDD